jgi:hypothetical protein
MEPGRCGCDFPKIDLTPKRTGPVAQRGTQIGTGRLSTGRDQMGQADTLSVPDPRKPSRFERERDRPGRHQAHFETAPFDRSGTSPCPSNS